VQSKPTSSHADWKETGIQTPGTNTARVKGALAFICWHPDAVHSTKALNQKGFLSVFQECLGY